MRLFISQSGPRSQALAAALEPFVRRLVPGSQPWMSPTGIEKGTRWGVELASSLKEAGAGLVCLTPENLNSAWILFEAGALSREPQNRVWTFLLDVQNDAQLGPQLSQFQNTKAERADVLLMIKAMNRTIATTPNTEDDLE